MAVKKVKLPNNTTLDINDARVVSDGIIYIGDTISSATYESEGIVVDLSDYQPLLVSGTNIKTINNTSLLGSGNITISGGSGVSDVTLGGTSVVSNDVAVLPAYPTTLPASDVSSWAKASSKPSYTATEVGALSGVSFNGVSATVSSGVAAITATIPTVPTISTSITSDATSDTKTASPKAVKTYVDDIVGDIETLLAAI